ncbi:MAG: hypothetical protein KGH64_00695 [Candidatus Micrarchaeota archaeon]|nr:hypothetical protein [Candidatus Micrarchaeota archaeon]
MKYRVYDNNKPASVKGFPLLAKLGWDNHEFDTWDEAFEYAKKWLGDYDNLPETMLERTSFKVEYSGYGDYLEIRREE